MGEPQRFLCGPLKPQRPSVGYFFQLVILLVKHTRVLRSAIVYLCKNLHFGSYSSTGSAIRGTDFIS
jgi:hypothetical protein